MAPSVLHTIAQNTRTVLTSQGPVEADITTTDGPVLLGCHGGMGGVDQCRMLLHFAQDRFKLLSLSRPGYLNTPLASGQTIAQQADLLAALLDRLNIEKTAVLAVSAGGPPAYTFAMRHPDRIWALVAVDAISGYFDLAPEGSAISHAIFMSDLGQRLLQTLTKLKPDAFIKQILAHESFFTKKQLQTHLDFILGDPQTMAFVNAFMRSMYPYKARAAGTLNDVANTRGLDHLPLEKVRCPALIVHGTHDSAVKFYDGVYAHEHIQGSERYWIEEGSHICFWIHPQAARAQRYALDFLSRHAPSTPEYQPNQTGQESPV